MSWRGAVQILVRLAIVAAVALSGMTFGADDAEARRGGKVRSSKERTHQDDASSKPKSDDDSAEGARHHYTPVPRVRSRESSRGTGETATDAGNVASRRHRTSDRMPAPAVAEQDIDVPGCTTGMICTVCVAGCTGDVGGIVDAQVKTPMPVPRE